MFKWTGCITLGRVWITGQYCRLLCVLVLAFREFVGVAVLRVAQYLGRDGSGPAVPSTTIDVRVYGSMSSSHLANYVVPPASWTGANGSQPARRVTTTSTSWVHWKSEPGVASGTASTE